MNYEELLEKAKEIYESEDTPHFFKAWLLANIIYPADESEDERIRKILHAYIHDFGVPKEYFGDVENSDVLAWLEKQGDTNETLSEWSEEDKQIILSIEQVMNCASVLNLVPEKIDNIKSWLKSLRPQKQWKPTEKQGEQTQLGYEHADIPPKDFAPIEHKILNADEVIMWIRKYWPFKRWENFTFIADDAIEKFKKDFGL